MLSHRKAAIGVGLDQGEEDKPQGADIAPVTYQDSDPAVQTSRADYGRLSVDDLGQILILHKRGLTQRKIAEVIGCSQPSVHYALQRLTEPAEIPQAIAKAKAGKALAAWDKAIDKAAERGDHRPARELIELAHSELRPQPGNTAGGGGVTINIGMPGQPVELPTITIEAAPLSPVNSKALGEGQ